MCATSLFKNTTITFNHKIEALTLSEDLHKEKIFTWFSFFTSLCKMIDVKSNDVTLEAFVLLKETLCERYIEFWSDRLKTFSKMETYCLLKQKKIISVMST